MRRLLNGGKLGIAIFGAGGTGKSTLGGILDEGFDPIAPPKPYKSSVDTEEKWLKSNDAQSLYIAPGQKARSGYWYNLLAEITKNKRLLILNVVSAGYHSTEVEVSDIDAYLLRCVQDEQELLLNLIGSLRSVQSPLKMVTVVAKQDLWFERQSEVQSFYEQGKYAEALAEIQAAKGTQNFQHEFVYTALTIQSLRDKTGRIITPNTAGYDLVQSKESLDRLFEVIEKFAK